MANDTNVRGFGSDPLTDLIGRTDAPAADAPPAQGGMTGALIPTEGFALKPIPENVLGEQGRKTVDAALAKLTLEKLDLPTVIVLGADAQKALGQHIDSLLAKVGKKEAPVLYELFEKLAQGVESVNLAELEAQVRKGDEPGWIVGALERIGWGSATERKKQATEGLREMLTQKSRTLLDLVRGMEEKTLTEVGKLLGNIGQLDEMGRAYLKSIYGFAVATQITYELLQRARKREKELVGKANESTDPQDIAAARDFQVIVQQLQNRALALRTAYEKIPADLEVLSMAKSAASATLAETANGIQQEFNDLKSALFQWHVLLQLQDLQSVNLYRRRVREALSRHVLTALDSAASTAAQTQGQNRLEDAQLLLGIGKGLAEIREKTRGFNSQRDKQFREAEQALGEAQRVLTALPAPPVPNLKE